MKRRTFLGAFGAATVCPLVANSQQLDRVRRIGVLTGVAGNDPAATIWSAAFERALQDLGWMVGRNLRIEYRFASNDLNSARHFAAELVSLPTELILSGGTLTTKVLKQETSTKPIVFVQASDPVG